jgi:DnaJ-class molecular chaperone
MKCPECDGTGYQKTYQYFTKDKYPYCKHCGGTGEV